MQSGAGQAWRDAVGGMWDEIGLLQFRYLCEQGLRPEHRLLDVGCGSLRGGVHFIRYLDSGCYFGVDRDATLLDAGRRHELLPAEFAQRRPTFLCRDDFDFSALATDFDTALAQSVFTHLPWNSILRCLVRIQEVLKPGGRFFATFFEDPNGSHRIFPLAHQPGGIVTHADRDPYHYEFSVFQELARRVGMTVSNLGDWKHPRNQKMMVFQQPFRS